MLLICVAGPLAEAKFLLRDPIEMLNGHRAQFDITEAQDSCALAGHIDDMNDLIRTAVNAGWQMLHDAKTWAAVEAVADLIPASGKVPGKLIAEAVSRAMV
jgi:hypothetical protein